MDGRTDGRTDGSLRIGTALDRDTVVDLWGSLYTLLRRQTHREAATATPVAPTVGGLTFACFISWAIFLGAAVTKEGARTFFESLTVQDALHAEFNKVGDQCFIRGDRAPREEYEEVIANRYDSAYMMKIAGAEGALERRRGRVAE